MQLKKFSLPALVLLIATVMLLLFPLSVVSHPESQAQKKRRLTHRGSQLRALPGRPDRFALVIGIDKYQDVEIAGLEGASNDARSVADALSRYAGFPPDQVTLLSSDQALERQPTRANILRRLSNLRQSVPREGLLLFYFSGHGMEHKNGRTDQAYLLPMDAQVSGDISLAEDSAISVESMRDRIHDTGVEQVIVILDACRSDPLKARAVGPKTSAMSRAFKKFDFSQNRGIKAFATLYATQVGEVAYEFKDKQQGYFTFALVEGLQGKAAGSNGEVTLLSLVKYVENRVPKLTALSGLRQQPFSMMEGYKADELILSFADGIRGNENPADQARDLLRRKMTFAVGLSVSIMGQSTQRVGALVFERSLAELGFASEKVQALSRRYEALENAMPGRDKQVQPSNLGQLSQTDFMAILRDHIREHSGDQFPAYVNLGYDVGCLIILLKFWDRLKDPSSLVLVAEEKLSSLQKDLGKIVIPAALTEKLRGIRANDLADRKYRDATKLILDAALSHFDM